MMLTVVTGSVGSAGEHDDYMVNVPEGDAIFIEVRPDSFLDPVVEIIDGDGRVRMGVDWGGVGEGEEIDQSADTPGGFTIRVSGAGNSTGGYTLEYNVFAQPLVRNAELLYLDFDGSTEAETGDTLLMGDVPPFAENQDLIPLVESACRSYFAPFNLQVTSVKPATIHYDTAHIGGSYSPGLLGRGEIDSGNHTPDNHCIILSQELADYIDSYLAGMPGFDAYQRDMLFADMLAKVIVHEYGHNLGLNHVGVNEMTMSYASDLPLERYYSHGEGFRWDIGANATWGFQNQRLLLNIAMETGYRVTQIEPNDTILQATDVTPGYNYVLGDLEPTNDRVYVEAKFDNFGDVDFYRIQIDSRTTLGFDIEAQEFQGQAIASLAVFDAAGNIIGGEAAGRDPDSGVYCYDPYFEAALDPGIYYVRVSALSNQTGRYDLVIGNMTTNPDNDAPRVRQVVLPENSDSFRNIWVFFDQMIDPATLTGSSVRILNSVGSPVPMTFDYDPTLSMMLIRTSSTMGPGDYTLVLDGNPGGITDYSGNLLDAEWNGPFPALPGNGAAGGSMEMDFSVTGYDLVSPSVEILWELNNSYGNGRQLTFVFDEEIIPDTISNQSLWIEYSGPDGIFDTLDDDVIMPYNYSYNPMANAVVMNLANIMPTGDYRAVFNGTAGFIKDQAGNALPETIWDFHTRPDSNKPGGPMVIGMTPEPMSTIGQTGRDIRINFDRRIDPLTLTTANFKLTSAGVDGLLGTLDDRQINDSDGAIFYDPAAREAVFTSATVLGNGLYQVWLNGGSDGIKDEYGNLLDGEFYSAIINGNEDNHYIDTIPSGNTFAGGDFRARFYIDTAAVKPLSTSTLKSEGQVDGIAVALDGDLAVIRREGISLTKGGEAVVPDAIIYDSVSNEMILHFNSPIPVGDYELTLLGDGSLRSPSGNALDGDADGSPGGNYVYPFTISAENRAPSADDMALMTLEDSDLDIILDAADPDGDPLLFTILQQPTHGTLEGSGANWTYSPAADYNGPDSFRFQAFDGDLASRTATASIIVVAVNDPPVAQNLARHVEPGIATLVSLHADDPEGDPVAYEIVTPPLHGTAVLLGDTVTYTPSPGFTGDDSFTYRAGDGKDLGGPATVSLEVQKTIELGVVNAGGTLVHIYDLDGPGVGKTINGNYGAGYNPNDPNNDVAVYPIPGMAPFILLRGDFSALGLASEGGITAVQQTSTTASDVAFVAAKNAIGKVVLNSTVSGLTFEEGLAVNGWMVPHNAGIYSVSGGLDLALIQGRGAGDASIMGDVIVAGKIGVLVAKGHVLGDMAAPGGMNIIYVGYQSTRPTDIRGDMTVTGSGAGISTVILNGALSGAIDVAGRLETLQSGSVAAAASIRAGRGIGLISVQNGVECDITVDSGKANIILSSTGPMSGHWNLPEGFQFIGNLKGGLSADIVSSSANGVGGTLYAGGVYTGRTELNGKLTKAVFGSTASGAMGRARVVAQRGIDSMVVLGNMQNTDVGAALEAVTASKVEIGLVYVAGACSGSNIISGVWLDAASPFTEGTGVPSPVPVAGLTSQASLGVVYIGGTLGTPGATEHHWAIAAKNGIKLVKHAGGSGSVNDVLVG